MNRPETPVITGRKPCGFCGDMGSHALINFVAENTNTVVCSDCIEIFYASVKNFEQTIIRIYPLTRQ